MLSSLCIINTVSKILLIAGALNWGTVGLFEVNLVHFIFMNFPILEKAVYLLVGLAGLYHLIRFKNIA
tara:strand:- start:728 stop:931 length:204 start_codon:yes stop_codon:yes gene_type:complete